MQGRTDTPIPSGARLIGVAELADWLGVPDKTIYRWAEAGTIPVTRLDRRLRFDVVAIDKWLKRNTEDAA